MGAPWVFGVHKTDHTLLLLIFFNVHVNAFFVILFEDIHVLTEGLLLMIAASCMSVEPRLVDVLVTIGLSDVFVTISDSVFRL